MVYKLDPNLLNPMDHLANMHTGGEASLTERELEEAFRRVHMIQQDIAAAVNDPSFHLLPGGMRESESDGTNNEGRLFDPRQATLLKSKRPKDASSNEKTGTSSRIQQQAAKEAFKDYFDKEQGHVSFNNSAGLSSKDIENKMGDFTTHISVDLAATTDVR